MDFDPYQRYYEIMRKVYGLNVPLPSRAEWKKMAHGFHYATKISDFDFDIETEQREGYAYDRD